KDADAAEGWLQPDNPAKSRRNADRAACIGTDGSRAQTRGNRNGGAGARPAGDMIERPRIMRGSVVLIASGNPVGKFVQIRFADQDSAGAARFRGNAEFSVRM